MENDQLQPWQRDAILEYVRVAKEAEAQANELFQHLDKADIPELARHLKTKPLLNPYSLVALAELMESQAYRKSGNKGADARHNQHNRVRKDLALEWFEGVRDSKSKNDAAIEIADKFCVSESTARDWLKGF
jgi:hypothetical protein